MLIIAHTQRALEVSCGFGNMPSIELVIQCSLNKCVLKTNDRRAYRQPSNTNRIIHLLRIDKC